MYMHTCQQKGKRKLEEKRKRKRKKGIPLRELCEWSGLNRDEEDSDEDEGDNGGGVRNGVVDEKAVCARLLQEAHSTCT